MKPGKQYEGYWDNEDLVNQLKNEVFALMEEMHPGKELVWIFDNSSNHHAKCKDGLCVKKLQKFDGGKQPVMRDSVWNGQPYNMQNERGQQKGAMRIIEDRLGYYPPHMNLQCKTWSNCDPVNQQCCAKKIVADFDDFKAQRAWLVETVEDRGHTIIFLPKFHCELNFIEMVWGYVKAYLRRHCSFNFNDLVQALPDCLDNRIPLKFFKRARRHCYRFMQGYRDGLKGPLLDYAIKKYSSHRRIPAIVLETIKSDFDAYKRAN